jgi:hypothetical protein
VRDNSHDQESQLHFDVPSSQLDSFTLSDFKRLELDLQKKNEEQLRKDVFAAG